MTNLPVSACAAGDAGRELAMRVSSLLPLTTLPLAGLLLGLPLETHAIG